MKTRIPAYSLLAVLAATAVLVCHHDPLSAQSSGVDGGTIRGPQWRGGTTGTTGRSYPTLPGRPSVPESPASKGVSAARKQVAEAETDQEKVAAERALREAVAEYFEEDMQHRERELQSVRQRVAGMESHLQKRVSAKNDIIQLQLKSFIYEADGLGLFARSSSNSSRIGTLMPAPARVARWSDLERSGVQVPVVKVSGAISRLNQLRKQLEDTKSDRETVLSDLKSAMSDHFDADLESREQALEEIKTRVASMQDHLAKRGTAKAEIIDLQVEMFMRQAEGLGFFGETTKDETVESLGPYFVPTR